MKALYLLLFKFIPDAPDGLKLPVVILAQLFADAFDMHIHRTGIAEKVKPPDLLEQLLARKNLARMGRKKVQ